MEIPLPSGASVTVADNTSPGARRAVRRSIRAVVRDGETVIEGSEDQWPAFLGAVITAWTYPVPIPSAGGGMAVLDTYPDTDADIDALEDALRERYERVTRQRPTTQSAPSPTNGTSQSS